MVIFFSFNSSMHRQYNTMTVEELTWAASGLGQEMNQGSLRQLLHGLCARELLDQTDADGCTPLMSAAQNDELDNMSALVKAGASVNNAAATTKITALMQAASCGRTKAVKWLLANGAAVDQRDVNGWTALDHVRVSKGNSVPGNVDNDSLSLVRRLLAAQMLRK
jgi:hypothetical protein